MATPVMPPPPSQVMDMFGAANLAMPLAGGQQMAWRAGDIVLKRLDMSTQMLRWQAEVLADLSDQPRFRVSPPIRAKNGNLTVSGWAAFRYVEGAPAYGRWADIIAVGENFHAAIRHLPMPSFLVERNDNWAIGDRVAWGELPVEDYLDVPGVAQLVHHRRRVPKLNQVIHGDLTGNVLFHPNLPPAVIDLSPYWRPPSFASAIVVADALLWHGADAQILDEVRDVTDFAQHLIRALIFRLVTDRDSVRTHESARYDYVIDLACALTGHA